MADYNQFIGVLREASTIEEFEQKLEGVDPNTYNEWKKKGFDVNHLFTVKRCSFALRATLLHFVTAYGNEEIAGFLIKNGANFNAVDTNGWTPLHIASLYGNIEIVELLLKRGANPLLRNKNGSTPRDLTKRGNIIQLLEEAEEKQLKNEAIVTGIVTALAIGIVVGVALGCATQLDLLAIIGIAIASGFIAGGIAGGIRHMISKPDVEQHMPKAQEPMVG